MEIVLLLMLLSVVVLILYTLYHFIRWILRSQVRRKGASISLLSLLVGFTIYQLFFVKLEFIQSRIYPDLYLVDNFPEDRDALHQVIKEFAIQRIKTQPEMTPSLRFYEYYNNYTPLPFQDAGTAYFLENEEDLGGMIVEDFGMYIKLKLAVLEKTACIDQRDYCGKLHFYKEGRRIKSEPIRITPPM